MAEKNQYTEAGKAGQSVRSALSSAYGKTKSGLKSGYNYINDLITEYVQEPFLNAYPQSVNLAASATEFGAGVAGIPTSQGRYPYYNLQTQFDKQAPVAEEPKAVERKQTEIPTITDSKPKAKPNLWRVMLDRSDPSKDMFADTEDDAKSLLNALKNKGENGAIAGIRISGKDKAEEEELKAQYIKRSESGGKTAQPKSKEDVLRSKLQGLGATQEQQDRYFQNLNRLRSEREQRVVASKEQAEKNKQKFERFISGEGKSKFASDIAAKDAAIDQFNQYNKQLSLLKKAYRNAGANQDYAGQFKLGKLINAYEAGVPKEMGARRKAAISGIIPTKNKELEENFRREREARIERERLNRANPDSAQFQQYPEY